VVKLSAENIVEIECLRGVAMATNFGTKIAVTGFVRTIATRQLVMEGRGSVVGRYLAHRGRCHGNHFLTFCIWVHIGAIWRIRLNRPCVAAMRLVSDYFDHLLWSPYGIGQTIIFSCCDLFFFFFFFPRLISAVGLDVYHTSTHGVALV